MSQLFETALPLDHVAMAVQSIDEALRLFELISGETGSPPQTIESQGVRVTFVGMIELLEPLGPDTTVGRFLKRRGSGLHHVAYRTNNIVSELARLNSEGIRLIDSEPRAGAHGLVAFLHPSSTAGVLVELVQHSD